MRPDLGAGALSAYPPQSPRPHPLRATPPRRATPKRDRPAGPTATGQQLRAHPTGHLEDGVDAVAQRGHEDRPPPAPRRLPAGEGCAEGVHLPRQCTRSVSVKLRHLLQTRLSYLLIFYLLIYTQS